MFNNILFLFIFTIIVISLFAWNQYFMIMFIDHIFPLMKASNILSAALGLSEGTIWPAPLIT